MPFVSSVNDKVCLKPFSQHCLFRNYVARQSFVLPAYIETFSVLLQIQINREAIQLTASLHNSENVRVT